MFTRAILYMGEPFPVGFLSSGAVLGRLAPGPRGDENDDVCRKGVAATRRAIYYCLVEAATFPTDTRLKVRPPLLSAGVGKPLRRHSRRGLPHLVRSRTAPLHAPGPQVQKLALPIGHEVQ